MRRRWAVVGIALLVVIVIAYYLAFLIPVPSKEPPISIPWIVQIGGNSNIPTGHFPINESAATEYVKSLIKDYNGLVDSHQALSLNTPSLHRFFPLYGSYQVFIARENHSAIDDRIEFLFVSSPSATSPQITVFTNETAQYLRPVSIVGVGVRTNTSYADYGSSLGFYVGDLTTESPLGVNHINAIWITNSSSVYENTLLSSNDAAHAIYNANSQDYDYITNPQFLSPRWFSHFAGSTIGIVLEASGAVATAITIYEGRTHFGWFNKPSRYAKLHRKSKTSSKKDKRKGTKGENEEPKKKPS